MNFSDFARWTERLNENYKRQLQSLLMSCLVYFDYDVVQSWVQDVFDAVTDSVPSDVDPIREVIESSHESIDELEDNLPF